MDYTQLRDGSHSTATLLLAMPTVPTMPMRRCLTDVARVYNRLAAKK